MASGMSGHERPVRGQTNEWHTPKWILDGLGPFDDDPCLPGKDDGLAREWQGFVWLNPPYGPECGKYVGRLADHGNGIALTFARTETKWFVSQAWGRADCILFLYGRLHFLRNGTERLGNAGAPSCLIGYGATAIARLKQFAETFGGALCADWMHSLANKESAPTKDGAREGTGQTTITEENNGN